ncbi:MAG: hypothetical protein ACKVQT_29540 [Burkholderiales bacterium]
MKALIAGVAVITGLAAFVLPTSEAGAQAYRCGSVYQDRPCDGNLSAKPVGGSSRSPTATNSPGATNAICAQRSADSQKIVWAREGGTTQESALAVESNSANRKLIADVYRVRGAVPDVRARIEAECKVEMEERAKALALHDSMVRAGVLPGGPVAPAGPSEAENAAHRAAAVRQAEDTQRRADAQELKRRCERLNRDLASNRSDQRGGGRGAEMDRLNRTRLSLERETTDAGC